jgi:hypothetical protein
MDLPPSVYILGRNGVCAIRDVIPHRAGAELCNRLTFAQNKLLRKADRSFTGTSLENSRRILAPAHLD